MKNAKLYVYLGFDVDASNAGPLLQTFHVNLQTGAE